MTERRRSPRVQTHFESLLSSHREAGVGQLQNIAYEGALLEDATLQPPLGTDVRIYVFIRPVDPFELTGRVVRHTERGFAIEFEKLSPEVRSLIDDAGAVVATPRAPDEDPGSGA